MIIAIDGPAASGKGTIAKRLAAHYRLPHLDTGLIYRATAAAVLAAGSQPSDVAAAAEAAEHLDLTRFSEDHLRSAAMGEAASVVAAIPEVRAALVEFQRRFAHQDGGAVLDGRDIGTAICPEAEAKLFVTATPETRAGRRSRELIGRGEDGKYETVLADIRKRDERDSARSSAPLKKADDAVMLDTTALDIESSVAAAIRIVEERRRVR
jgi:cytidylate kinase